MERRGSKAERRGVDTAQGASEQRAQVAGALVAARGGFATWLREQREHRGQSIEDVARVTRIQQRTLERLEHGRFDELPADVFVRGFIRNYARCVGIDADEALARYGDCGVAPAPVASVEAQALLETMAALAPSSAATSSAALAEARATVSAPRVLRARASSEHAVVQPPIVEAPIVEAPIVEAPIGEAVVEAVGEAPVVVPVVGPEPVPEPVIATAPGSKRRRNRRVADGTGAPQPKRRRKGKKAGASVEAAATNEPIAAPAATEDLEVEIEIVATPPAPIAPPAPPAPIVPRPAPIRVAPVVASRVARRVPTVAAPSLVIDDDDPDSAERAREAREADAAKEPSRRSFLPPILLDEERSGRQGGLTLAVIILLIVATLTLSYLMRRPGSSSEGVTAREIPARVVA